jgi:hypothetical protein
VLKRKKEMLFPSLLKNITPPQNFRETLNLRIPPIFRWGLGQEMDETDTRGGKSPTKAGLNSPTNKLSQLNNDLLFTVLKDAYDQLKGYLSYYPQELRILPNAQARGVTRQDVASKLNKIRENKKIQQRLQRMI